MCPTILRTSWHQQQHWSCKAACGWDHAQKAIWPHLNHLQKWVGSEGPSPWHRPHLTKWAFCANGSCPEHLQCRRNVCPTNALTYQRLQGLYKLLPRSWFPSSKIWLPIAARLRDCSCPQNFCKHMPHPVKMQTCMIIVYTMLMVLSCRRCILLTNPSQHGWSAGT